MFIKAKSLNEATAKISEVLLESGVKRETRGFNCIEHKSPMLIQISDPMDRFMTIKGRNAKKILPFVESLWIMNGLNTIKMPAFYVPNIMNFSDDGETGRATYGPRVRAYSGLKRDYKYREVKDISIMKENIEITDQFQFCVDSFEKDLNTRQALITIHDPMKDDYDSQERLKVTKDQPCTRSLHFMMNTEGKLDLTVHMRSNDVLWGFSAVNVSNFSIMQWLMASVLGVPVGNYYHITDNIHFYVNFKKKVAIMKNNFVPRENQIDFAYDDIKGMSNVDSYLSTLLRFENMLRKESYENVEIEEDSKFIHYAFYDSENGIERIAFPKTSFFGDWSKVFWNYFVPEEKVSYVNPFINELFGE